MVDQVNPAGVLDDEAQVLEAEAEPIEAPTEKEPTQSRRSRRAAWQAVTEATKTQAELADEQTQRAQELEALKKNQAFQAYQAQQQQMLEQERNRAARLENQMLERAAIERKERLQVLETQMEDEDLDPTERHAARQDYIALATQEYHNQLREWDNYKRAEISARGLDPLDPQFNREYTPGQAGLFEFQADLQAADNARLRQELVAAKKAAVDPDTLAALVRKEVARLAAAQGLDTVDLGEPAGTSDSDDVWERDLAAFQSGRMSPAEYTRRWGRK